MPVHRFDRPAGRIEEVTIRSEALAGNLLGDPTERVVAVYLPPGYDASPEEYPLLVDLVGFTGSGLAHLNWRPFGESVPQRVDRLVAEGRMGPVVVAFPDCFTSLGGNQYIDSLAMGNWARFLVEEMLPELERRFRIRKGRQHRAVFGKSSGGYGAITHGMRYADAWGAVACHSGDMAFEWCYWGDLPRAVSALARHDGVEGYLAYLRTRLKLDDEDLHVLSMLAMAASYDPDPVAPFGLRLPVDLHSGRLDAQRWEAWLAHDPVRAVALPEVQDNLRRLSGLYIDCGVRDQYHLVYGARQLVSQLKAAGIRHHYEEFDDDHTNVDYRLDVSLPFLYTAVTGGDPYS